jgi:FMN-dependent NADH-azoreductase
MKILVITANPKPVQFSVSLTTMSRFIEIFKDNNQEVEFIYRDVSDYPHLSGNDLRDYRNPDGKVAEVAKEFASYDRYIFVSPMWNLSIPSGMKAYIDHLVIPEVTFTYVDRNPKPLGLIKNKKALFITSSGGHFGVAPMNEWDHNVLFMKHILDHMGIEDFTPLYIPIAHRGGVQTQERVQQEMETIKEVAKSW